MRIVKLKNIKDAIRDKKEGESRKGKLEGEQDRGQGMVDVAEGEESDSEIDIGQVECLVGEWVALIELQGLEKDGAIELREEESVGDPFGVWEAWDDVHGGALPIEEVRKAQKEEVTYMQRMKIWELRPIEECYEKTGKEPVSVWWVDTNKGTFDHLNIRCSLAARDFKGKYKLRDDLFAETPSLEVVRMILSRAATRRRDRKMRKVMFIDARKAHLNPKCPRIVEPLQGCVEN